MDKQVFISEDDGMKWETMSIEEFYTDISTHEDCRPFCWVYYNNKVVKWNDLQLNQCYNDLIAGTGKYGKRSIIERASSLLPKIYHFKPVAFVATRPSYIISKVKKVIVKHRIQVALKDYKKSA